jgi:hypothetical protein
MVEGCAVSTGVYVGKQVTTQIPEIEADYGALKGKVRQSQSTHKHASMVLWDGL